MRVDMLEMLPTPWGLVRSGVAHDHWKIKAVSAQFEKTALDPRFRLFGCDGDAFRPSAIDLRTGSTRPIPMNATTDAKARAHRALGWRHMRDKHSFAERQVGGVAIFQAPHEGAHVARAGRQRPPADIVVDPKWPWANYIEALYIALQEMSFHAAKMGPTSQTSKWTFLSSGCCWRGD